jgi:glycosyltransferase involved in cell wall biosynthesis
VTEDVPVVAQRKRIAVAVCTYKRNESLAVLLNALTACAHRVKSRAAVGVAIVDDTADGDARSVAEDFADKFELGMVYRISGKQNISIARNLALQTALEIGDWIAMTDDDCEPPPQWIEALLDVQEQTGAEAATGRMERRVPPGSPRWITEQPFLQLGLEERPNGVEMDTAATHNSMISGEWLRQHPDIRFNPNFGVIGGEDMVFFRAARAAGLRIRYSSKGYVYENEQPSRATFGYQLYAYLWQGNSSYHTCVQSGRPAWRMFVHGCASLARALLRPVARIVRGQPPQWRYCLALAFEGIGKLLGPLGVHMDHR